MKIVFLAILAFIALLIWNAFLGGNPLGWVFKGAKFLSDFGRFCDRSILQTAAYSVA